MTTSSNPNQSGESEELRPKLLALLKGGQVINNTTDHNERSVLEMLYGEKADQIEELIQQRELEAEERGYCRGASAALGRLGMKKSSRHKHTLQLYGDQTDTGYMGVRMVCIDKKCNLVTVIADEAKHNELLLSKQKGNDNE